MAPPRIPTGQQTSRSKLQSFDLCGIELILLCPGRVQMNEEGGENHEKAPGESVFLLALLTPAQIALAATNEVEVMTKLDEAEREVKSLKKRC